MNTSQVADNMLLIDKPSGVTSFDVIRQLRKQTGLRKFGHAGTLDPLATGLLVLGVGPGTKLLKDLVGLDKEYEAQILLGQSRRTSDMEGEILEQVSVDTALCTEHLITDTIDTMVGTYTLPVSTYSAIKKDGVPFYKRARKAEQTGADIKDIPRRTMVIRTAECTHIQVLECDGYTHILVSVRFLVGSGTYIRSLAEELGRRLSLPAVLYNLRRTQVGEFRVEDATQLSTVTSIRIKE